MEYDDFGNITSDSVEIEEAPLETMEDLIDEIKCDLGGDVVSLAISDKTIKHKIQEALRKVSSYAPRVILGEFQLNGTSIKMPPYTTCVVEILSADTASASAFTEADVNLFSYSFQALNQYNRIHDPYTFLTNRQNVKNLLSVVSTENWHYDVQTRMLYVAGHDNQKITVRYMIPYTDVSQVKDEIVLETVHDYARASCKVTEGLIRRKFQSTPGAMQLDGDALINEGRTDLATLDQSIPKTFSYLRFGLRSQ